MTRGAIGLKFATLNIGGPSVDRAARILEYLLALDADVWVLTETRATAGTRLIVDAFSERGHEVVATLTMAPGERGVAVIAKAGQQMPLDDFVTPDLGHRLAAATIPCAEPLTAIGAYVPSRDTSPEKILRKQRFLAQMTELTREWSNKRLVFIGDLNILARTHVPRFSAFKAWEYSALEALERNGLADAYTQLHPDVQVHSWIGRKGAGYRYDYAFVAEGLVPNLVDCAYDHEPRLLGISDHAAVVLTLRTGAQVDENVGASAAGRLVSA